jgi:RNA polymerase sigma-70 factor, ECF subfamily
LTGDAADDGLRDFEPHRRFLAGLAYRMLGSVADAEDVIQDAFLRWRDVDRATVAEPRAYLARVVSPATTGSGSHVPTYCSRR